MAAEFYGGAENAPRDVKMTDQCAGHEIAGHENAGHEIAGHKRAGHEIAGHETDSEAANVCG